MPSRNYKVQYKYTFSIIKVLVLQVDPHKRRLTSVDDKLIVIYLQLENVLIDRHGRIKLADFGFVKETCATTLSRTYCGSKSYAAPEVLEGRPYPPLKADVWAYGVIIYIMVTGIELFDIHNEVGYRYKFRYLEMLYGILHG